MDANQKYEERRELIAIFNNLSPPLKKQLLTLARVIDTTQALALTEKKRTWVKKPKNPVEE